ncbi:MAG: hypothetical protein Q9165_007731 [Trypethelium subeluteriae]
MARLQTYGKVRRRQIRPVFDFSSPEKDEKRALNDQEVTKVTSDLKELHLTGSSLDERHSQHLQEETILVPGNANASSRRSLCKRPKDADSADDQDKENDLTSSHKKVAAWNKPYFNDNTVQQTSSNTLRKEPVETRARHDSIDDKERRESSKLSKSQRQPIPHSETTGRTSRRSSKTRNPEAGPDRPIRRRARNPASRAKSPPSSPRSKQPTPPDCQDIPAHIKLLATHADVILSFPGFADSLSSFHLSKIAEASYSEVYRLSTTSTASSQHRSHHHHSPLNAQPPKTTFPTTAAVLKLIPLKPPPPPPKPRLRTTKSKPKTKSQKSQPTTHSASPRTDFMTPPHALISELTLLRLLTPIPGFTAFRSLRLLHGRPAPRFIAAYRAHRAQRVEELRAAVGEEGLEEAVEREFGFPDPGVAFSAEDGDGSEGGGEGGGGGGDGYAEGQWWAVLEMADAGTDLEGWRVGDVMAAWDVFWRVAIAVGKGEASVGFEHRDLHAGNVCVKRVPRRRGEGQRGGTKEGGEEVEVVEESKCLRAREGVDLERKLGFTDVEVTVIDYTNSRAEVPEEDARRWRVEEVAYKNLEEELDVFETRPKFGYQYRIPRFMRDLVLKDGDPDAQSLSSEMKKRTVMKRENPSWREYHPKTNLLWLHFLLTELMDWTKDVREETRKNYSGSKKRGNVESILKERTQEDRQRGLKELDLERKLLKVAEMLMPSILLKSTLNSVSDLIEVAWRAAWLEADDILQ